VAILYGITAALLWGTADFLARFATRRVGVIRSLFYMEAIGVLAFTFWIVPKKEIPAAISNNPPSIWIWVVASALLSTVASLAFYRALETGVLSVVSPVCSAYPVLTLALSFLAGEKLRGHQFAGIALAIIGVTLASTSFAALQPASKSEAGQSARIGAAKIPAAHLTRGVGLAIFASATYGLNFWLIGYHIVPALSGTLSVWATRALSVAFLPIICLARKQSLALPRGGVWWMLVTIGLFDTTAYLASNLGLATGHISLVTVFGSLFGAVTVFLAWAFLKERLERTQWLGIALIFAAIILVST
jgi:drug/metabolite transporter (DMT)-like permease